MLLKKTIGAFLLLLFVVFACKEPQKSISDYESIKVKFAKSQFHSNNGEFSILLPSNWSHHEDPVDSDTVLYTLESGSKNNDFAALGIMKMNLISESIDKEFHYLTEQITTRANNITVVEKSRIKIEDQMVKTALVTYKHDGKISQVELDFFIPINDSQYYILIGVCDMNAKCDKHIGMIIQCAKSFKRKNSTH